MRAWSGQVEWRVLRNRIDSPLARLASGDLDSPWTAPCVWSPAILILQPSLALGRLVHIQLSQSLVPLVHIQPSMMPLQLDPYWLVPLLLVPIKTGLPSLQLVPIKQCLSLAQLSLAWSLVCRILRLLQLSLR